MGPVVAVLMAAAAVGGGAMLLRLAGVDRKLSFGERAAWAFALGIGVLGWLAFFPALLQHATVVWLGLTYLILVPGLLLLGRPEAPGARDRFTTVERLLVVFIALVFVLGLIEGWAPPADADSLAYHFALPKLFLGHGGLYFIPRANDGAAPLLQQMTYMVALGVGGERAMTLWAGISSWALAAVFYVTIRRHVNRSWSLAATLLLMTTPAVIYGAGTGQVEVRNAAFVLVAAVAAVESIHRGDLRFAALAGCAAGFYVASKYPGLLILVPLGLMIIAQRRWFAAGTVLSLAAIAAGGQWYAWNWWNTGDPVFPMLYGIVPYPPDFPWNMAQHHFYKTALPESERSLPQTVGWLLAYPIKATFAPTTALESGRTGFGPLLFVLLPFALYAAWWRGRQWMKSPVLLYAAVAMAVYALWFFLGPSQRVRFLLPVYPLVLLCFVVAAVRSSTYLTSAQATLTAGFAAVLTLHLGAQGLFSSNYLRYIALGESRDAFLARNVSHYDAVRWANDNLEKASLVFNVMRQVNYLFERPYFYSQPEVQAEVEVRPDNFAAALFWRQLKEKGVTHIFGVEPTPATGGPSGLVRRLVEFDCARELARIPSVAIASRTLRREDPGNVPIYVLSPRSCRLK